MFNDIKSQFTIDAIVVGAFMVNCYLVCDQGQGMLIDPGDEANEIDALISKRKIELMKIVLTHGHADHIGAVESLKSKFGAPVCIHRGDAMMLVDSVANLSAAIGTPITAGQADVILNEGDHINIGSLDFEVIHCPGHSPGGISLYEPTRGIIFTGDTLFEGSIGRTDFPGSDHDALIGSIKQKLLVLPDNTVVYPGHESQTTIGNEKLNNPWL